MSLQRAFQDGLLEPQLRKELVGHLWNKSLDNAGDLDNTSPYFTFYEQQCRQSLFDRGRHSYARTHEDIVNVARLITDDTPFEEIVENLQENYSGNTQSPDKEIFRSTVLLVARLLTMMKIGTLKHEFSGQKHIDWTEKPLRDCVGEWFPEPVLKYDTVKLDKIFNAANLESIGGLKIVWTDNIAEHLSLRNDDTEVFIFHHATFLKGHNT